MIKFAPSMYPTLSPGLPEGLSLTWRNISCSIDVRENRNNLLALLGLQKTKKLQLLHEVSGSVVAGALMAIMGPSGAGKTTLLATISRRIKGKASGEVFINGELIDKESMIKLSGFMPQEDLVIESLTVQEHLEFMARMKMDRRFVSTLRKRRITNVLSEMGLAKCCKRKLSSLSGGERKKVSLATQLLTEPSILFCDEPTTGLDSYTAATVVKTLRDVATKDRIVICSLHQPASGLLDIFHELLLLSNGRVAFQGSVDEASRFFNSLGLYCPLTYNKAEFFVSQLSTDHCREMEYYKKIKWICGEFQKSPFGERITKIIENHLKPIYKREALPEIFTETTKQSGDFTKIHTFTQLRWITWRSYIDCKRNIAISLLRFVLYLCVGCLISIPYYNITAKLDQGSIQNMQGLLYLVVVETIFTFNYGVFHIFPQELPLLLRDMAAGLYSPAPYYISKILTLIPGAIFQSILFSILIFIVTGLNGGFIGFVYFTVPVVFCAISATAFGCFLSVAFESIETAFLLSVPIDFLGLSFCGIYLQLGNLSNKTSWIRYLSQFYYGLEAISINQWQQIDHIGCPVTTDESCISTGPGVLDKYNYKLDDYYTDLFGLLAIFLICHLIAYITIYRKSRKEPVY